MAVKKISSCVFFILILQCSLHPFLVKYAVIGSFFYCTIWRFVWLHFLIAVLASHCGCQLHLWPLDQGWEIYRPGSVCSPWSYSIFPLSTQWHFVDSKIIFLYFIHFLKSISRTVPIPISVLGTGVEYFTCTHTIQITDYCSFFL